MEKLLQPRFQNASSSEVWNSHGARSNVTFGLFGVVILLSGWLQYYVYKKFVVQHLHENGFRTFPFATHFVAISLAAVHFAAGRFVESKDVLSYEVIDLLGASVACIICMGCELVSIVESCRNTKLIGFHPGRLQGQGQGSVVLITWTYVSLALFVRLVNIRDKLDLAIAVARLVLSLGILGFGFWRSGISETASAAGEETAADNTTKDAEAEKPRPTWKQLWRNMSMLLPYIWPKKSHGLQLRLLLCLLLVGSSRLINLLVPIYSKAVVDSLSAASHEGSPMFCWDLIVTLAIFEFMQGRFRSIRTMLWSKIEQNTSRKLQVRLFRHLHTLSLRWHLSRKTGEVLRVFGRGAASVNDVASYLAFELVPLIVDLVIAVAYFATKFDLAFGVFLFGAMGVYLACSIVTDRRRMDYYGNTIRASNEESSNSFDSLLNFETVKCYGAESYEIEKYKNVLLKAQAEHRNFRSTMTLLNTGEDAVSSLAILAGSIYCAQMVTARHLTVGDYTMFLAFADRLTYSTYLLGVYYRILQESMTHMGDLVDLLSETPEIRDDPEAIPLVPSGGKIELRDVSFGYSPDRQILKNVSFVVNPGETVALVGQTGSGKSTIVRLIFRFYDVTAGEILVDGQNIKLVTQDSLRREMGVVPQDTVLFNETIGYNIRYGRLGATQEEVESAAEHADIHRQILGFKEGYETKVGERGLKLSGGEKQRVAVARMIIKAPRIVLLDEATSSLDTQTEKHIQNALNTVCNNRTAVIVAHRLSTIVHADCILVFKEGEIIERGRHEDLLALNGTYWAMWNQQSQAPTEGDASDKAEADMKKSSE